MVFGALYYKTFASMGGKKSSPGADVSELPSRCFAQLAYT